MTDSSREHFLSSIKNVTLGKENFLEKGKLTLT